MVAAVIVLFNPDTSLLDRLLRSVVGQVGRIYIIDNTPGSTVDFSSFYNQYWDNISYIPLGDNKGIATAQNIGISASMDAGCSHVLLLDQDSALPSGMVKKLLDAEEGLILAGKQVASVGPVFIDEKTGSFSKAIRHGYLRVHKIEVDHTSERPLETDYIIASGSLIRTSILQKIGRMMDELFIDWVDIEWGLRAKDNGYTSYIIPNVLLRHSVGETAIHVLGREVSLHNDTRNYYIVRNSTYLLRVGSMGWKWRTVTIPRIPKYVLMYSWYSDRRLRSLGLLLKAFWDGIRGKLGRLN
jgi:rhamnosyltransferase